MKKFLTKITSICVTAILILSFAACSSTKSTSSTSSDTTKKVTLSDFKSEDGKLQISAPNSWKSLAELKNVNSRISIGIGDKSKESYTSVISESKENVTKEFTLDKYYSMVTEQLKTQVAKSEITDVKDITVNGNKGKSFQLKGEVNNIKVTYLYGLIDSPNYYSHVLTWSLSSSFDKNKATFADIINSFKETSK